MNYRLAGLLDNIEAVYSRYNKLLEIHGYGATYKLPQMEMFIIEGIDKVREVI